MKKLLALLLPLLLAVWSASPAFASTSTSEVIDKHGAKTYLGSASDWGKTWDENNFEDVTGENVTVSGNVTVKDADIDDLEIDGSSSRLIIQGGTMQDVTCDGTVSIKSGTLRSLNAASNVTITGGTIRHDVDCTDEVTLTSTVSIGGNLSAQDVTFSSGVKADVAGTVTGSGTILLNSCTLKAEGLDGDDSGQLEVNQYSAALPPITNMESIVIDGSTTATVNDKITAGSLLIKSGGEFLTTSSLELDTLQGPGTLYFRSGKLTVHDGITEKPLLVFSNSVGKGTIAFYADSGAVSPDDVRLYNFELESVEENGTDEFRLADPLSDGITFNGNALALSKGGSATIKAHVEPDFSDFATGTKVVWTLYGDSSVFSKSPDSSGLSCKITVSASATGSHKATLVAYLVDSHGDRLNDYRSDSCTLTTGYEDSTDGSGSSDVTLDTTSVSILTGDRYWVLARTSSGSAPHSMSYNSSVATVGAGVAAKDKNGNSVWLYPITGTGKGKVTVNIGGKTVAASVSGGIRVDTSSYTMSPGGTYVIGVAAKGIDEKTLLVFSDRSCAAVKAAGKSGDLLLYRISGVSQGSAVVTFSIPGGGSVSTLITVQNGAKAAGSSARLVALA